MASNSHQNRLVHQKSPYLLQHAYNPVDWYPWGEEAFEAAKAKDKPIFLSIGYATCHWCHVMSRESFSNPEVANMMNQVFINIKVDREELPEIDSLYMEFAQALMASGSGWPLNVLLTPDLKPFYAITYLPPESHQGMMGLKKLATHIEQLWNSDERELLFDQAEKLVDLFTRSVLTRGNELPSETDIDEALEMLFDSADPVYGGMKGTPKFPMSYHVHFFLGYAKQFNDARSLFFVETTLNMMCRGGIYDQVGGGFARYSVDEKWIVPHFEKMLYDNAILSRAYLEAWKYTKKASYQRVTKEIIDYILRDMKHFDGGFYSAEDADTEEKEGTYYLWSKNEIYEVLPKEDAALFCEYFDVTEAGNFEGKNILHSNYPIEEFADFKDLSFSIIEEKIDRSLKMLAEIRSKRERPFKDDKILVSWNALMIDALLNAGLAFEITAYIKAAIKGTEFIYEHLWKEGKLLRRFREGQTDFEGCLDDYAFLIRALIALFEGDLGVHWLKWAIEMTTLLEKEFKADEGAFYFTSSDRLILLRRCELYDGAQPSGNAIHAENLLRLYQITRNREYLLQAEDILKVAKTYIETYPQGTCYHLVALQRYAYKDASTVIVTLNEKETYREKIAALLFSHYHPNLSIIWKHADDEELFKLLPYLKDYPIQEEKTTVYLCKQGKCLPPAQSWEAIEKLLRP